MSIEERLERVEAILDARGLDWDHPRVEEDHFAGANKMVAKEPAKEVEPPASERPPEPEYREPVLPADAGKWAEFSHDGINWMRYKLRGCHKESEASLTIWSEKNIGFRHCRIKKDA